MYPRDLAPGDAKCATGNWADFDLCRIQSCDGPGFRAAFDLLLNEFGPKGELEPEGVIARRLQPDADRRTTSPTWLYEMLLVTRAQAPVGVRDHTAIVIPGFSEVVVHMSHNLVLPAWRRSGIAGWLRALPIQTARECLKNAGLSSDHPISLVAEMESADSGDSERTTRLLAYEKAGYRKVDPSAVHYLQPDFRDPSEIDADGRLRPIPLCLLVRRVGRESMRSISGREVREIVESLYQMYAVEFRKQDMQPLFATLKHYPADDATIDLVAPSQL